MTHPLVARVRQVATVAKQGRINRIFSTHMESSGPAVAIGTVCEIQNSASPILTEVVAVQPQGVVLAPLDTPQGVMSGMRVEATAAGTHALVGDAFLGRAVDALGRPIDGLGAIHSPYRMPLDGERPAPMRRTTPRQVLPTGIRAIDGLLTLGKGQRVGVFAAAGAGKTSLMTQLARNVVADRVVACLIGERGREIENFWSESMGPDAKERSVLVAASSDQPAAMRVRAARYAVALASHWRSEGYDVLLLMDSATRLAMALREVGLAAGEPPTVRAYTPNVFAALPRLIEQCGALKEGGSVTAVLTVLAETDDADDPLTETLKSILDGHIILSRRLAEAGRYPAIDVPRSVSRMSGNLKDESHKVASAKALSWLSAYEASRTLIESGLYTTGADDDTDAAIANRAALTAFLVQPESEAVGFDETRAALSRLTQQVAA